MKTDFKNRKKFVAPAQAKTCRVALGLKRLDTPDIKGSTQPGVVSLLPSLNEDTPRSHGTRTTYIYK